MPEESTVVSRHWIRRTARLRARNLNRRHQNKLGHNKTHVFEVEEAPASDRYNWWVVRVPISER